MVRRKSLISKAILDLLEAARAAEPDEGWLERSQIAAALGGKRKGKLYPNDIEQLEGLFADGLINKRLDPDAGFKEIYQYRVRRRPLKEVILGFLRETHAGAWVTEQQIAEQIFDGEQLSGQHRKLLYALITDGFVEQGDAGFRYGGNIARTDAPVAVPSPAAPEPEIEDEPEQIAPPTPVDDDTDEDEVDEAEAEVVEETEDEQVDEPVAEVPEDDADQGDAAEAEADETPVADEPADADEAEDDQPADADTTDDEAEDKKDA